MRFERREHRPLALVVLTPLLAIAADFLLHTLSRKGFPWAHGGAR